MTNISAAIKEIIDENPDTMKPGTVANNVAKAAYNLAYARGLDVNGPETADLIRDQLDSVSGGSARGASTESRERQPRGDGKIKLSPQEQEVARACGIDLETYASGKAEMIKYKRQGMYGHDESA